MSPVQSVEVKPLNIVSAGGKKINGFNAFLASTAYLGKGRIYLKCDQFVCLSAGLGIVDSRKP